VEEIPTTSVTYPAPAPPLFPPLIIGIVFCILVLGLTLGIDLKGWEQFLIVIPLPVLFWVAFRHSRRVVYLLLVIYLGTPLLVELLLPGTQTIEPTFMVGGTLLSVSLAAILLWNIDQRKKLEATLHDALEHLGMIFDQVNDAILVETPDGRILDANQKASTMYGYPREVLRTMRVEELVPPEFIFVNRQQDIPGNIMEAVNIRAGGELFPVEVSARWYMRQAQQLVLVVVRDITRRKQAEELLMLQNRLAFEIGTLNDLDKAASRLLRAARSLPGVDIGRLYLLDTSQQVLEMAEHQGYDRDKAIHMPRFPLNSPLGKVVSRGLPVYFTSADPSPEPFASLREKYGWRAFSIIPILFETRVVAAYLLGSLTLGAMPQTTRSALETISFLAGNVLARLQAEARLRTSEARFRNTFESATIGLFQTTPEGQLLTTNLALAHIVGCESVAELMAFYGEDVTQAYVDANVRQRIIASLANGEQHTRITTQLIRKNGKPIDVVIGMWTVMDDEGQVQYLEGFIEDITEHNDLVQRLELLHEIGRMILEVPDPQVVLPMVVSRLHTLAPFDLLEIWYHPDTWRPQEGTGSLGRVTRREIFFVDAAGNLEQEFAEYGSERSLPRLALEGTASYPLLENTSELSGAWLTDWLSAGLQTCIGAPLNANLQLAGEILLFSRREGAFTPVHLDLVNQLASLLSIGLQDSGLRQAEAEARRQMESRSRWIEYMRDTAESLNQTTSSGEVMETGLRTLQDLTGASLGWVSLLDPEDGSLYTAHIKDVPFDAAQHSLKCRKSQERCACYQVFQAGQLEMPQIVDCALLEDLTQGSLSQPYHIAVPIHSGRKLVGAVNLVVPNGHQRNGNHRMSSGLEQVLSAAGAQLGVALERAGLFEQVQELAIRDSLTGLYNRRYFFDRADYEYNRSRRYGSPLSLLMIDLDHFKQVNDTYGHPVGDEILRQLAQRLLHSMRNTDLLARYGGEEFIILLANTPAENTGSAAQRLMQILYQPPFQVGDFQYSLTVSIGISSLDETCQNVSELIERADLALYAAKRQGRDCYVEWLPEMTRPPV
jgi:diguanylate cyclase (GGDEF)-like protein/PAS domain S-box-containing protein